MSAPKKKKTPATRATLLARLRNLIGRARPAPQPDDPSLGALQARLGYKFRNPALLEEALTHPSYAQEMKNRVPHNQRLEFLGDAVLNLALAERLFHDLPQEREGALARARSALGKGELLAELARRLGIPPCLRLARGEIEAGGRDWQSAQEDAFEALIGAVFLDGGYAAARDAVRRWFGDFTELRAELLTGDNPKGRLQEWLAQRGMGGALQYRLAKTGGPEHAKTFHIEVVIQDEMLATGDGRSKKEAEEKAAQAALAQLRTREAAAGQQQQ